jgi:predicted DNA-binding transcriptional regulator YafY
MDLQRGKDRHIRLQRISHLLYRHPRGLTVRQLADLCQTTPRTIQRDLKYLGEANIPIWEDETGPVPRYGIIEGYYLPPVHFNLEDAITLTMAARLLGRYADYQNRYLVDGLAKLAGVMPEPMARHVHMVIEALQSRPKHNTFPDVFRTVALGWATGRIVELHHQPASRDEVRVYHLATYLIEPSASSQITYALGYCTEYGPERLMTFKLERATYARLTEETFQVPEDFDPIALLNTAWDIMYRDSPDEPLIEVVLRFAPEATRRVKESVWHPSQVLQEDLTTGRCILKVYIANTLEIEHFIHGWGPRCEVLAPADLRAKIADEARRTKELYDVSA